MSVQFTFTSANTAILINDKLLSGVFKIEVHDKPNEDLCDIVLNRHIIGDDKLVNEMRTNEFSFKLLNNTSSAGYVAATASVKNFYMSLSKEDNGKELLLEQIIIINTSSFLYSEDARSIGMKVTEEEDLKNLINIIKENQAKSVIRTDGHLDAARPGQPAKELNIENEDLVWLNAKDPRQLKDIKSKKLKKNKKKAQ